jgi:hypothetical protein
MRCWRCESITAVAFDTEFADGPPHPIRHPWAYTNIDNSKMMAALESAMREKTSQGSVETRAIDNIGTLYSRQLPS